MAIKRLETKSVSGDCAEVVAGFMILALSWEGGVVQWCQKTLSLD